jgi:hypothetical protein
MTEPMTMASPLNYDDMTATQFRRGIAETAHSCQARYKPLTRPATARTLNPEQVQAAMDAMYAANFGWGLAAVIGWVRHTYGEDAAWRATAAAEEVMTNGDSAHTADLGGVVGETAR